MEVELSKQTSTGFANAKNIYRDGGNSKSHAKITLSTQRLFENAEGTLIEDTATKGEEVRGKIYLNATRGQNVVKIQYYTSEYQERWVMCRVGGLVESRETNGCQ